MFSGLSVRELVFLLLPMILHHAVSKLQDQQGSQVHQTALDKLSTISLALLLHYIRSVITKFNVYCTDNFHCPTEQWHVF